MGVASPIILDRVQFGRETSRGVAVAATRRVPATARTMAIDRTLAARSTATGGFVDRTAPSYSRMLGGVTVTEIMGFENLAFWLPGLVGGDGDVAGDAGTPVAYTRNYLQDFDTDTLASYTAEGLDKLTPYQFAQCMINQWNMRFDGDSTSDPDWLLEMTMLSLRPTQQAVTTGLTTPANQTIPARGTKVYINEAGETIGTSQRTGMAISGSISGNNNLSLPAYLEDELGPPPGSVIRGPSQVDAQLVLGFQNNDDVADFMADEPVLKKIRLERSSAASIHTTVKKRIRFDLFGYWSGVSWGDRNGERTITLSFMGFYDQTAATAFNANLVNALNDPIS